MRLVALSVLLFASAEIAGAQPVPTWKLVEEWRVGGEISGPHSFTKVVALRPLSDGRVVVLEGKDQQIHILGARGDSLKTVGRRGGGPGEFAEANGVVVAPNGEIVVHDVRNARLTFLGSRGDFLRTVRLPPWGRVDSWDAHFDASGHLIEYNNDRRRAWNAAYTDSIPTAQPPCPNIPVVASADLGYRVMTSAKSYWATTYPFGIGTFGATNATDDSRWIGVAPDYRTIRRVMFGSCNVAATIVLAGPVIPVPANVYAKSRDQISNVGRGQTGPDAPNPDKVRRTLPAFESLTVDAEQRLWVERLVPGKVEFAPPAFIPKGPRQFDVFARTGAPVATVDIPAGFKTPRTEGIVAITGERVYGFVLDSDDLPYLVCYRIVRG